MSNHDPNELQNETPPVGTWTLLVCVSLAMTAGWLFLYFGVFLPRGVVH